MQDTGNSLIVKIADSKTKTQRSFVISESFYPPCKKYMDLRPIGENSQSLPFFLNFKNGKCTRQVVGINKIGTIPKKIAEYLGLPNAKQYTGHCLRRSSATILVDAGGDMLALKRHGGWRSSAVAESYVDNSARNITANSTKITCAINNRPDTATARTSKATHTFESHETGQPSLIFNECQVTINNYYNKE